MGTDLWMAPEGHASTQKKENTACCLLQTLPPLYFAQTPSSSTGFSKGGGEGSALAVVGRGMKVGEHRKYCRDLFVTLKPGPYANTFPETAVCQRLLEGVSTAQ